MTECGDGGCNSEPYHAADLSTEEPPSARCNGKEPSICMKCKTSPAAASCSKPFRALRRLVKALKSSTALSQPASMMARQRDPLCGPCFIEVTSQKFRTALRLRIAIDKTDVIMLCYSGGPSSRALLHLLLDYHSQDKKRPSRNKVAFDLIVAHVDEGAAAGWDLARSKQHASEISSSLSSARLPSHYIALSLEDLFLSGSESTDAEREAARQKVTQLVMAVKDTTGREDLVKHLRESILLSCGRTLGATRLAKGDSSDRLAARVIALASKGSGFALPSSLHFIDARHGPGWPMWISPCREVLSKDLALLVHMQHLGTVPQIEVPAFGTQASINDLSERFIAGLQVNMPSTVFAVLNTACKLQAFSWNQKSSNRRDTDSDFLCCVCSSPMAPRLVRLASEGPVHHRGTEYSAVCDRCRDQFGSILPPHDLDSIGVQTDQTDRCKTFLPKSMFYGQENLMSDKASFRYHLPELLSTEAMRQGIQDCIL